MHTNDTPTPTLPPPGMAEVTKDWFFEVMNPQDVHPSSINSPRWHPVLGYRSDWKLRNGALVGVSYQNRYFLPAGA